MAPLPQPLAFFLVLVSGWVNRQQTTVIEYLKQENRLLGEQLEVADSGSPTTSAAGSPSRGRRLDGASSGRSPAS